MSSEAKMRKIANGLLAGMKNYYPFIPTETIDAALSAAGFNELEPAIYCGREGRSNEKVGPNSYLSLTWYKMENNTYEIVCYVS
jgi:hypothetical protein